MTSDEGLTVNNDFYISDETHRIFRTGIRYFQYQILFSEQI